MDKNLSGETDTFQLTQHGESADGKVTLAFPPTMPVPGHDGDVHAAWWDTDLPILHVSFQQSPTLAAGTPDTPPSGGGYDRVKQGHQTGHTPR